VPVSVGAQDVGQHQRVAWVGLAAGLPVPFPVARDRTRVDRIDREPGPGQRGHQQVLVGLDRDRRVFRAAAVLGDQAQQRVESGCAGVDPGARQLQTLPVQQRDVVVRLGPVNPAGDTHPILLVLGNSCVELEAVRRPDMGQRSVARHLTSRSRTSWRAGRVTVYVRDLVTCPCHHMQ
jgi:hypothetical protein